MYEDRINAGAALLDEQVGPGWTSKVDSMTLDMSSSDRCVLGQVFGGFDEGCQSLGIHAPVTMAAYGFYLTNGDLGAAPLSADRYIGQYRTLRDEWINYLADRHVNHAHTYADGVCVECGNGQGD